MFHVEQSCAFVGVPTFLFRHFAQLSACRHSRSQLLQKCIRRPRKFKCYNAAMKAHVWVMPKRTVLDPQGQTIQHALAGLGYAEVKDVRQGKFFVLDLDGWSREDAQRQLERISKDVLTNPVIEEYRFEIID
jgi:phosphoribosylformylglycinamidine synthase PurS subunit